MTRPAKFVFAAFLGTQVLDAALTFVGVTANAATEANPLIVWLASHVGLAAALFVTKCAAGAFGAVLAVNGRAMLLAFLTLFYWAMAILPWMLILGVVRF